MQHLNCNRRSSCTTCGYGKVGRSSQRYSRYGTFHDLQARHTSSIDRMQLRMGVNIALVWTHDAAYRQRQTSNLAIPRLQCGR
jgi:hypothetical protein